MPDLDTWQALRTERGVTLLDRCQGADLAHPGTIEHLRRQYPPELVAAAIELTLARQAAQTKFGDSAPTLFADRQGVQMASSLTSAFHKASRFAQIASPVLDLCSGIGADSIALTQSGLAVTSYDIDPVRAWMTAQNAGCEVQVSDITAAPSRPDLST
jgi:predicted nicotinamide N-methyase